MRRAILAAFLPALTALAGLVAVGTAQAREPVTVSPFTLPAGVFCPFAIDVGVVANNEYQDVTTLADGTTITKITGKLVLSFKNDSTGYTIVRNVSGPTTETVHPDGTGTEVGAGNSSWEFGPNSQANTGEPGLVFTSGRVVLSFTGDVLTGFSLSGTQVNGCDLLAG